jgi:hypothetical protein
MQQDRKADRNRKGPQQARYEIRGSSSRVACMKHVGFVAVHTVTAPVNARVSAARGMHRTVS